MKHHRAEIGVELNQDYWGKGIASEAFRSVLKYGFQQKNIKRDSGFWTSGRYSFIYIEKG
ncbi:GNAT family N-acetyltransferase [Fictibacillus sp. NRS-1165]|uniref:GNAT family N-acetyltransferase n=1 Tax=Fictibacillus sp. NRS-1165 TaxID=3144463 RepID=UPI003D1ACB70